MAKYKLKALNCFIGGRLYKKEDNDILDSTNFDKKDFDSLVSGGYLVEVKELKKAEPVKPKQTNG